MGPQCQVNSTSETLPALLIPAMLSSSRGATWIDIGPFSGSAVVIRGRIVSTPRGVSTTSQQGGGSTPAGHFSCVPMIHPRCCNTMESGELKSWLETMPVLSQNNCGALNVSEVEIKSAARRRLRKSPGEQARSKQSQSKHSKALRSDNFAVRMNVDYGRERLFTNRDCLRGRKGAAATWPSTFFPPPPSTSEPHPRQYPPP